MGLFRRKDAPDNPEEVAQEESDSQRPAQSWTRQDSPHGGPYDVEELDSLDEDRERLDFGSVLVPAVNGMQVRMELDEAEQVAAVSIMLDDSVIQLQAFAAPRTEGLWDEVRQEIAEGIRADQGRAREFDGTFGRELRAQVNVKAPDGTSEVQDVRFIGADGPRWFVRGLITGAGATDDERAHVVEEIFGGVAVRRGDHAASPREPLPLLMPEATNLVPDGGGQRDDADVGDGQ